MVWLLAANTVLSHVSDTKRRSEEELGLLVDNSPTQYNNNDIANHIFVGEPRGFMWTYVNLLFGKLNSQLALQQDTADQSLGKRLGLEACCMYIATAVTAISAANTQSVRDIASFSAKVASDPKSLRINTDVLLQLLRPQQVTHTIELRLLIQKHVSLQ